MPTGEDRGAGFGWGAYRSNFGGILTKSTTNKCVSLSHANARYLDGIAKGHKSAAVNSALTWYRGQGIEIHELLANIEALQEIITELHAAGRRTQNEESEPLGGGIWARLVRMWPF